MRALQFHRLLVLGLTFIAYAALHAARKPASVVKSVLHPHLEDGANPDDYNAISNPGWSPFNRDLVPGAVASAGYQMSRGGICSLSNAGLFHCDTLTTGPPEIGNWCLSYESADGKWRMTRTSFLGAEAKALCSGNNISSACWIIEALPKKLSQEDVDRFCIPDSSIPITGLDCTVYMQDNSNYLPSLTEDSVDWRVVNTGVAPPPVLEAHVSDGKVLLGALDSVYLAFYASGMFLSGHIADNMSLRYFLTIGMIGSGLFAVLFGLAQPLGIHSIYYFMFMSAGQGLFQSMGWPAVVAIVGNWYGKGERGLVMGIWNAHSSTGNILGSTIASLALSWGMHGHDWPAAYFTLGAIVGGVGIIVFIFLKERPEEVGLGSKVASTPTSAMDDYDDREDDSSRGDRDDDGGEEDDGDNDNDDEEEGGRRRRTRRRRMDIEAGGGGEEGNDGEDARGQLRLLDHDKLASSTTSNSRHNSLRKKDIVLEMTELPHRHMQGGEGRSDGGHGDEGSLPIDQQRVESSSSSQLELGTLTPGLDEDGRDFVPPRRPIFIRSTKWYEHSFLKAFRISGVVEFALALFFCKLVAYTFMYWLPYYLGHNGFTAAEAGQLSVFVDIGGILGGILAGFLSDKLRCHAPVCFGFLLACVPGLYFYRSVTEAIGASSIGLNIVMMLVVGALSNGPYLLISSAVAADLGSSLQGNAAMVATVTGIIDGTGSVGASVQGILVGGVSSACGWSAVFYLLMLCTSLSAVMLCRLVWKEARRRLTRAITVAGMIVCVTVVMYSCGMLLDGCDLDVKCV